MTNIMTPGQAQALFSKPEVEAKKQPPVRTFVQPKNNIKVDACSLRGDEIGVGECGCASKPKVYECNCSEIAQGYCMLKPKTIREIIYKDGTKQKIAPKEFIPVCDGCKYREDKPAEYGKNIIFTRTEDLARDALKLIKFVPPDCKAIIGIPRSGMIPASILAAHLQLPLGELQTDGKIRLLGAGGRGKFSYTKDNTYSKYFIVDDSCHGGGSLRKARAKCQEPKQNCVWAVVYNRDNHKEPDVWAVDLDHHSFDWNIHNNGQVVGQTIIKGLSGGLAYSFDCFTNSERQIVPRLHKPPLVVATQSKAYCEEWFKKWGIQVQNLIITDNDSPVEFQKAKHYKASNCSIFFEPDNNQCQAIANLSKKPVINPITGEVFNAK